MAAREPRETQREKLNLSKTPSFLEKGIEDLFSDFTLNCLFNIKLKYYKIERT